jgi:threonine dehydratase
MAKDHRLSLKRIEEAVTVIDPVFLNSPQFLVEPFEAEFGCRVVVKVETLNPIRSFKGRGAEYYVASLKGTSHLTCATAGNFGQGMAYAARKRRIPITIFVAANANPLKVDRMRALGAEVRLVDEIDPALAAKSFAKESGAQLVEDGRDPAIGEGAGTIGIEILHWPELFDSILVPVGDGSLIAGISRWVKAHQQRIQMIGICAKGSPAMERSWRNGKVHEEKSTKTIADGLDVPNPYAEAVAEITGLVDDFLLVEDQMMLDAMRIAHQELGIVLEPSGAAGLGALLAHREKFKRKLVCVILTGSNITAEQMDRWLYTH